MARSKRRKQNGFAKAGEVGVKVLKAVYVDTTKWGYRKGRGKK